VTWVPPLDVQIEFTKETCVNYPSDKLTITSQLSCLFFSIITGGSLAYFSIAFSKYKSTYAGNP